jgi:L-lactate dehydrogenase complex protein LldE
VTVREGRTMKKVSLFVPCLVDQFLPEIGEATALLLSRSGVDVHYDPRQTCCGQPFINAGRTQDARKIAERMIDIFSGARYVVAPSGSCVHTLKNHYLNLFPTGTMAKRARQLSEKVYELSDFLVSRTGFTAAGVSFPHTIAYHHSCHILRALNISQGPLTLLSNIAGARIVALPGADVCCGFGGEFCALYPDISAAMVEQKVTKAVESGAEYLVLGEPGCILNIRGFVQRKGLPLKVLHISQLLIETGDSQ